MSVVLCILTLWLVGHEEQPPRVFTFVSKDMRACWGKESEWRETLGTPGVLQYSLDCLEVTGQPVHGS